MDGFVVGKEIVFPIEKGNEDFGISGRERLSPAGFLETADDVAVALERTEYLDSYIVIAEKLPCCTCSGLGVLLLRIYEHCGAAQARERGDAVRDIAPAPSQG